MPSSRLDSYLSSLISFLYLFLLFLLPLLFSMKSSEVFEFPKMLFVYTMTVLIVACWISRMIVNRKFIYTRTPLEIPIYFFLLSQLFSTFSSIDIHTSFFGYYSRWNGGLLPTIAYTLLYFGYVNNISAEKGLALRTQGQAFRNVNLLIGYTVLASATIVSIYAILQRMGIDRNLWVQDVMARVFSTQGQPNWLAAHLVMIVPLAWWLGIKDKGQRPGDKGRIYGTLLRPLAFSLWLLFLLAIFFTRSRSGFLGFAVADVVFWSLVILNLKNLKRPGLAETQGQAFRNSRFWRPFLIAHGALLIVLFLTNNPARELIVQSVKRQAANVKNQAHRSMNDERRTMNSITDSGDIRRIVWTGALQLVKERPFFGWGPETFAYTYWRARPVEHNLTSEWNFLYNKAHNEWLNLAANTGLFGLITHLLLVGWFTVWSIKQVRSSKDQVASSMDESKQSSLTTNCLLLTTTLSAILGAESVNLFGFSTVTTQTYSYIFMGIAIMAGTKGEGRRAKETTNGLRVAKNERIPLTTYCLLLATMLSTLYLLSQISISFLADLSYNRGKQYAKAGYLPEALADLESAVGLIPDEPVFRSELAETQGVLAVSLSLQDEEDAAVSSLKDFSLMNFRIVGKQSPANVSFLRTRARVTYTLGSLNPSLYDQGIELMERTMDLAPTDPKIPYNLGVMLQDRGQIDDAKKMFEKSIELKPDYDEAQTILESFSR